MSAGWVLVQTSDGAAPQVADALTRLPGVELAEPTAGAYDVVARVAGSRPDTPTARRVMRAALRVPGVTLAVCCQHGQTPAASESDVPELDLPGSDVPESSQPVAPLNLSASLDLTDAAALQPSS